MQQIADTNGMIILVQLSPSYAGRALFLWKDKRGEFTLSFGALNLTFVIYRDVLPLGEDTHATLLNVMHGETALVMRGRDRKVGESSREVMISDAYDA